MNFAVTTNANLYARSLSRYATETGKTISQAVAREGPDFRTELFRQFRDIHPSPKGILNAAQARGYRVRRLNNTFLVKTANGLDARAVNRAKELLGGQKSELFRPLMNGLVPVRFSSQKGNRRLQGGRTGRRFAQSALRAYQLPAHILAARLEEDRKLNTGVRALNLRALSVYLELLYRKRAAQGGTMAVQWLFKNYKWSPKGTYKTGTLIQRSVTNLPIGTLDFDTDFNGNLQTIIFNGYVPGTGEEDQKHGVVSKVFGVRAQKLLGAIQQHNAKLARQSGY
jgi:uncharacterized membrane protein